MKTVHRGIPTLLMRAFCCGLALFLSLGLAAAPATAAMSAAEKNKARSETRNMASATLNRLYKVQPSARKAIANSAGYAVFSKFGM
jgi:hypothetical protein